MENFIFDLNGYILFKKGVENDLNEYKDRSLDVNQIENFILRLKQLENKGSTLERNYYIDSRTELNGMRNPRQNQNNGLVSPYNLSNLVRQDPIEHPTDSDETGHNQCEMENNQAICLEALRVLENSINLPGSVSNSNNTRNDTNLFRYHRFSMFLGDLGGQINSYEKSLEKLRAAESNQSASQPTLRLIELIIRNEILDLLDKFDKDIENKNRSEPENGAGSAQPPNLCFA